MGWKILSERAHTWFLSNFINLKLSCRKIKILFQLPRARGCSMIHIRNLLYLKFLSIESKNKSKYHKISSYSILCHKSSRSWLHRSFRFHQRLKLSHLRCWCVNIFSVSLLVTKISLPSTFKCFLSKLCQIKIKSFIIKLQNKLY